MIKLLKIRQRDESKLSILKNIATPFTKEYFFDLVSKESLECLLMYLDEKIISEEIKENSYEYYLVSLNSEDYIGYLVLSQKKEALNISKIYLKKEYQNKGYGKQIINLLKDKAYTQNYNQLRICIPSQKHDTCEIVKKFGFLQTHEIARFIGNRAYIYEHIYLMDVYRN